MLNVKSIEIVGGVSFAQLQHDHCRWLTDGLYCGEPRRDERTSYCAHHHRIAYRPSGDRSFSAARFMPVVVDDVQAPREGTGRKHADRVAHPPSTPSLDQFVRAAAAARRLEPPVSIVVRSVPVKTPYVAPRLSESEFGVIERWYLHSLSRQCDDMVGDFRSLAVRGREYAIRMRDWITYQLDITINELTCNRRTKDLVASRHFVMFCLCKGATELSLPYLGRELFGGFDHTSLIHGRDKIAREIAAGTLASRLDSLLGRICEFDNEIASAVRKLRVKVDAGAPT